MRAFITVPWRVKSSYLSRVGEFCATVSNLGFTRRKMLKFQVPVLLVLIVLLQ